MATKITIGNKTTGIPNVYGQIKSGIVNSSSSLDFGNVVIIDRGNFGSNDYTALGGINGELKSGLDAVYEFSELSQIQSVIWDSELIPIFKSLFKPSKTSGTSGVNKVFYLQASTTTKATTTFPFSKGTLTLRTNFEGSGLNGSLIPKTYTLAGTVATTTSNELSKGFAIKLEKGRVFGYSLCFYRGQHSKQEDPLNLGFTFGEDFLPDINTDTLLGVYNIIPPVLLFRSPDFKKLSDLKRWMDRSPDFKKWFSVVSFPFSNTDDAVILADISSNQTALAPYKLFANGTTTFSDQNFTDALELTKSLDSTFYLALNSGANATGVQNTQISQLCDSGELRFQKYVIIPAYGDSNNFTQDTDSSLQVAKYFNSQNVIVVHGLSKKTNSKYPSGYKNISMLEKTAKILGRICGLNPQTPITFKDIDIDSEVHKLKEVEKEAAIEGGLLCTNYDSDLQRFVILAGVNSLGNNDFLVNEDATSYDIAVERIKTQLNKEIVYNAKRTFFNNQTQGPNRNTVSEEDVKSWLDGFLSSKVATQNQDNLIIRYANITVTTVQDNMFAQYEFVPNFPVNKLVIQGVMLGK